MSSSELKIEAKERLTGKRKEAAVVVLLVMIVSTILAGLCGTFSINTINPGTTLYNNGSASVTADTSISVKQTLGSVVSFVVNLFLALGTTSYFLKISRGEDAKIEELWSKKDLLLKAIAVTLLSGLAITLGFLLFIIPGIILACGYSMVIYLLLDNPEMGTLEILKNSRTMMQGNKWRFFCLVLSFIGWYLLVIPTLGLITFWLTPYLYVTQCAFYNNLIGKGGVEAAVETEVVENNEAE